MLVALQRTGEDRALPTAAEHLVRLLRSWGPGPDHLPGLALAGITVPSRLGPRFVDALVFTRSGVVVIAAHSPGPQLSPLPGAGERAGAGVAAAKGALAGHDGGRFVTGLVVVVPPRSVADPRGDGAAERAGAGVGSSAEERPSAARVEGGSAGAGARTSAAERPSAARSEGESAERAGAGSASATPQHGPAADLVSHWPEPEAVPGVAVVFADSRGLRRIIAQHNRWRTVWSADDVLDACYALSLAHLAPSRSALLADGFPARLPAVTQLPQLPAVVTVPPDPPSPTEDEQPAARPRGSAVAVFPRPRPIRQVPWGLLVFLTLLVAIGVVAAVFVNQVFHGS
ncbi:hypothetical protein [Amycolatopsis nalaikhensis]|uniref:NERD domain-containing protein n=1 Tax=Amycolatopsis nalaikhensis TaxID=715472 RepID=A0ABY8XHS3_9PSEU|nr:hypothetical protein [Amycolatopsis sp. 2-2]WIV55150.1 hypothetical protein QP939_41010 [Amycolatopsis sp. 2-2]